MLTATTTSSLSRVKALGQIAISRNVTLKPDVAAKNIIHPLSAYDLIAKDLIAIHTQFIDLEDVDNIIIVANDDTQFDKIIQLMDRSKEAGFSKINLAKLGG